MATCSGAAISLDYDDGGRLRHIVRPGSTIEYQYNARDWITAVLNHTTGGATLFDSSYAYQDGELWDHTGNPLVRTEVADGTTYTTTYRYDALGRLTEEARTPGDYSLSYGYDLVGNRISQTEDGTTVTFIYDDNDKLTSGSDGSSFGYDLNGTLTSRTGPDGSWTLVYNEADLLASVTYPDGADSFVYDLYGRRTRADLNGSIYRYVYYGDRVLEQTDDSGNVLIRYATASGSYYLPLLALEFSDGSVRLPLSDLVGTSRRLVAPSGEATDAYSLDAFGRSLGGWGNTLNPYRYGANWGYVTDPSGLLQLGDRTYWPATGRFLQQDAESDDIDGYLYAGNDPLVSIDPEGLAKRKANKSCPKPKQGKKPSKPKKPKPPKPPKQPAPRHRRLRPAPSALGRIAAMISRQPWGRSTQRWLCIARQTATPRPGTGALPR